MNWLCRVALAPAFTVLVLAGASAAPDYIEANPKELTQAYGEEVANRAFSDELTEARTTIIKGSIVPAHECPAEPEFVLRDLYPSKEALDEALASGSVSAYPEQFDELDALLKTLD